MAAAVVGTTVGLYIVVTQDTDHGAEHHPLGDPHGEGGAEKHGTDSTIGDENKSDEPEEETQEESIDDSKDDSKDESKEEPTNDQEDPNKATKQNSEAKDHQSPDKSDKVSVLLSVFVTCDSNIHSPIPARKRVPRAQTRRLASKRASPTTKPTILRKSPSTPRRARRVRVLPRLLSSKEPSQLSVRVLRTRRSEERPRWTRTPKPSACLCHPKHHCHSTLAAAFHPAVLVYCLEIQ
jgi:hypothetical protein